MYQWTKNFLTYPWNIPQAPKQQFISRNSCNIWGWTGMLLFSCFFIRVCPKILWFPRSNPMTWGWDLDHQSYDFSGWVWILRDIMTSWWLNHPSEKYSSKWVHLPQFSGWKFQKNIWIFHHHPKWYIRRRLFIICPHGFGLGTDRPTPAPHLWAVWEPLEVASMPIPNPRSTTSAGISLDRWNDVDLENIPKSDG